MKLVYVQYFTVLAFLPFSILERIDVGETTFRLAQLLRPGDLSVSSNGSTWVKLHTRTQ